MKEQISALMDDELSLDGNEHLFAAVKHDGELRGCWSTYHLIGDAMRGNPITSSGFTARVIQKIQAEPAVLAPRNIRRERRPVIWSMAASAAAVTFVAWVVMQQNPGDSGAPVVEVAQAQSVPQPHPIPSEYLYAHQSAAPSSSSYFIQPASFSEHGQ
jgi:sigma-E factor negative regulatory protein RseA